MAGDTKKRQIHVRLPSDMIAYLDEFIARGAAADRGDALASVIESDRRRRREERDVEIYRNMAPGADDASLLNWLGTNVPDLD